MILSSWIDSIRGVCDIFPDASFILPTRSWIRLKSHTFLSTCTRSEIVRSWYHHITNYAPIMTRVNTPFMSFANNKFCTPYAWPNIAWIMTNVAFKKVAFWKISSFEESSDQTFWISHKISSLFTKHCVVKTTQTLPGKEFNIIFVHG